MSPTKARVLTPSGRGAIAVVEVLGPGATEAVSKRFTPAGGAPFQASAIDAVRFGLWRHDGGVGDAGEEVVVVRTAIDRVEVHCHGGDAAPSAVLASLAPLGVTIDDGEPGSPTFEADAMRLVRTASTDRVAAVLLDQANGALRRAIDLVVESLDSGDLESSARGIDKLLRHASFVDRAAGPARVVLAGAPNAGKSSLINALVGYERAIVFDRPGTTRDVVTAATAIDGWPVTLADTAGVREASDPLEAAGVALARQTIATADVLLRVREAAAFDAAAVIAVGEPADATVIDVASKADLAPSFDPPEGVITTSVVDGRGIAELLAAIGAALGSAPSAGEGVPFRVAHVDCLSEARDAIERGDAGRAATALRALLAGG